MDSVRAFKTLARQRLKEHGAPLQELRSLQKTQHLIAQEAGFTNWATLRSADDFERRLALLMHDWPQLTSVGMDGIRGTAFGTREFSALSPQERDVKYTELRKYLRGELDAIRWVHDWLIESVTPLKGLNRSRSSYGLKHLAEELRGDYLTNGAFIAGALLAGFISDVTGPNQLERNVTFNMSERDLKAQELRRHTVRRDRRFAGTTQPSDRVFLSLGPDYDDGELIARSELPDYASRAVGNIDGSMFDGLRGDGPRWYEEWVVEQ
ncbi:hypothetical protein [Agrococcus beijingensis]|uniref:hypothetical protein n=1 Tax=Agrococcus beijingensis TaxID=3068634 RepID=UPI002741D9E2|nr:hypothetical protein [Agrococcus sp. REN33]